MGHALMPFSPHRIGRRNADLRQRGRRRKQEMSFTAAASGIQLLANRSDAGREDITLSSRAER